MYRDDLEALRENVRDLDRTLAKRPPPLPDKGPTRRETWEVLCALVAGVAILIASLVHVIQTWDVGAAQRLLARNLSGRTLMREWTSSGSYAATIVSKAHNGGQCAVEAFSPPCHARIRCGGKLLYEGNGQCLPSGYIDRGDSWLDGTPQCEIDLDHRRALVRDIGPQRDGSANYPTAWQVDLELP